MIEQIVNQVYGRGVGDRNFLCDFVGIVSLPCHLEEYAIVYFKTQFVPGDYHDSYDSHYKTTEFRKYKSDGRIQAFFNGNPDVVQSVVPSEVTTKLFEMETYDVVLQKIEVKTQILVEIRKCRDGHYDKKKGEFMIYKGNNPKTWFEVTKEEVEQEVVLVPSQIEQQKIQSEQK